RTVPKARFDFHARNVDRLVTGAPVLVDVKMTHNGLESTDKVQFEWRPKTGLAVRLISPVGDERDGGLQFAIQRNDRFTPFETFFQLEFTCYRSGDVNLGTLDHWMPEGSINSYALPSVRVQQSHRVPFFAKPFGSPLMRLGDLFSQAEAIGPQVVALVGQGGVGKTRLGEEFGHVVRRRAGEYIAIDHATTLEKPHQFLAALLARLIFKDHNAPITDGDVLSAIEALDPALAARAGPSIEAVFSVDTNAEALSNQDLIAAFILLAHRRALQAPLLLHLRNLHWASVDVLRLLEAFLWQLQQFFGSPGQQSDQKHYMSLMVILEGRVFEEALGGAEQQTTRLFEGLLTRVACDRIECPMWDRATSHEFSDWLFEDAQTADLTSTEITRSVTQYVKEHVGGTPFEIIEFTRLLRDLGYVDFKQASGRVIATRPVAKAIRAGRSLLETIRARLAYLDQTDPELGLLLRAVGYFDDAVPYGLFVYLRERLASSITDDALEKAGFLSIPEPAYATLDTEVRFQHEHYFQAMQHERLGQADTQKIVTLYLDWLAACPDLSLEAQFLQARARLLQDDAGLNDKKAELEAVIERAARGNQIGLQMRAVRLFVDTFAWSKTGQEHLNAAEVISAALQEVALCETLIDSGDRILADQRLQRALTCLEGLTQKQISIDINLLSSLFKAQIRLSCTRVQALRNNGEPARAMAVAREIQAALELLLPGSAEYDESAMHGNFACALAYAAIGDMQTAHVYSGRSVPHARRLLGKASGALNAISTHGVITSRFDSVAALDQLLDVDIQSEDIFRGPEELYMHRVHICRARVHRLLRAEISDAETCAVETTQVSQDLNHIYATSFALGYLPQAAAAALLLGALKTVQDAEAALSWFAKSVVCAGRARQQETLLSAQSNFAQIERQQYGVTDRGTAFA
ncbi:ATP-binding protein, partial [Candidatus Poribacteria bacterium]|nr:ATP-binding protein [Candidatus Poribacteria bacterium]